MAVGAAYSWVIFNRSTISQYRPEHIEGYQPMQHKPNWPYAQLS